MLVKLKEQRMIKELIILIGMFLNLFKIEIEMNIVYLVEWMKDKYDNIKNDVIKLFTNDKHNRDN